MQDIRDRPIRASSIDCNEMLTYCILALKQRLEKYNRFLFSCACTPFLSQLYDNC